jgi:hypothetical protein
MAAGKEFIPVHLVGSMPLSDAAEVFRTTAEILGSKVSRMPDGETGPRKNWVGFQYALMARHPQLEFAGPPSDPDVMSNETAETVDGYNMPTKLRLRAGVRAEKINFDALGYSEAAAQSYAEFSALKRAGKIGKDTRMLVAFPTPMAPVAFFVQPDQIFDVLPAYAKTMMRELGEIAENIPHTELAFQWDVALEFALWEGLFPPPPGDWKSTILDQLSQLGDAVPADVNLGYHLCYGDRGHKHFIEPKDTANLVEVANGLSARVKRTIEWIHLPVPRDRTDADYYAPLRHLKLKPGTELYLGLLHLSDGIEGARQRMEAAKTAIDHFGIGAECGMGRRDPQTIVDFLKLHHEAAATRIN